MEITTGNVVILEVDVFVCVVLSTAEKHVTFVEIVGTAECITLKLNYNWIN